MSNLLGRIRSGVGNLFSNPNNASVSDVLSSPLFSAGMGLLQAGQDSRINPIAAVQQGLLNSEKMRLAQEEEERRRRLREAYPSALDAFFPGRVVGGMEMNPQPVPRTPGTEIVDMGPPTPPVLEEDKLRTLFEAIGPEKGATALLGRQLREETLGRGLMEGTSSTAQHINYLMRNKDNPNEPMYAFHYNQLARDRTIETPQGTINIPANPLEGFPKPPGFNPPKKVESKILRDTRSGINNYVNAYNNFYNTLNELGVKATLSSDDAAALESTRKVLMVVVKDLLDLGVLAGPDMGLLEAIIPDTAGAVALWRGKRGISRQLEAGIKPLLESHIENFEKNFQTTYDMAKPTVIRVEESFK